MKVVVHQEWKILYNINNNPSLKSNIHMKNDFEKLKKNFCKKRIFEQKIFSCSKLILCYVKTEKKLAPTIIVQNSFVVDQEFDSLMFSTNYPLQVVHRQTAKAQNEKICLTSP